MLLDVISLQALQFSKNLKFQNYAVTLYGVVDTISQSFT